MPQIGPVGGPPPMPQQPHGFEDMPQGASNTLQAEVLNAMKLFLTGDSNGAISQINQLLQQIGTSPAWQGVRNNLLAARSMISNPNAAPSQVIPQLMQAYFALGHGPSPQPVNTFQAEVLNAITLLQGGDRNGALSQINQLLQQIGTGPGPMQAIRADLLAAKSAITAGVNPSQVIPNLQAAYSLLGRL